jgi:AraC-like DNA-binding protein
MNRIYFSDDDPRFDAHVRFFGVGRKEVMPPGFVSRQRGLPAFLCVLFHDPVLVELMGRRSEVLPGTMILWDSNRPHHFGNGSHSWSHSWVVFSGEDCKHDWMRAVFERPQHFKDSVHLLGCFANLLREFQSFDKPDLPIISANIQLLLREMCREQESHQQGGGTKDPVKTARRWVAENLRQELSVGVVAKRVSLSPSRLQQLFRSRLNCSVQQFVERERLREARYWLMHTGLRINEIAEKTGFSDAFYFSRRFTRAFGQNPREYRKINHGDGRKTFVLPRKN